MAMNNSELRQMRIAMKQCEDFREQLEVVELENGYLQKKIAQLEQELEWAKKEVRELKCQ